MPALPASARLLLRDDDAIGPPKSPAFYICDCGFIGQVGVGPVLGSEGGRLVCRCGTTMVCPDIGCDHNQGERIVVDTIGGW